MNVSLGFGHPLPLVLLVIGVIDLIALPFLMTAYVREALGPHPTPTPDTDTDTCTERGMS